MVAFTLFSQEQLTENVHAALKAWHGISGNTENLLESLRLVQARRSTMAGSESPSYKRLATNEILLEGIDALEAHDQTGAQVLRLRFPENNKIMAVAHSMNISEHTVSRIQKAAIVQISQIIYDQEMALREQQAQELEAHLPPSEYTHLFGIKEAQTKLVAYLLQADVPWMVSLVGIGGIGKTSLADAVTRQVIREFVFDRVVWLRTEPQTMDGRSLSHERTYETIIADLSQQLWPETAASLPPDQRLVQVRQALKTRPHLIIIDNLETDTSHLLVHLNDLTNPSKFLLTSRTRPADRAHSFNFSLNELSLPDATGLIRYHAQEIGVPALAEARDDDIATIYDLTGGNPLALKLVVSLLDVLPLPQILADLSQGRQGPVEDLYKHIYWQTWQILSQEARDLLQAMPLVSETGGLPPYLQEISGLSASQLWPAVQELRKRSLLEVRGTIHEKRYGIHRLTETFLRTEIIHWPEVEAGSD
jgi:predicted DNA-binding protein (UPF0251 family)